MPPRRARGDIKQALRAAFLSCVDKTDADDHHALGTTDFLLLEFVNTVHERASALFLDKFAAVMDFGRRV